MFFKINDLRINNVYGTSTAYSEGNVVHKYVSIKVCKNDLTTYVKPIEKFVFLEIQNENKITVGVEIEEIKIQINNESYLYKFNEDEVMIHYSIKSKEMNMEIV